MKPIIGLIDCGAGEMMERYPDLALVDYGFLYHKDPVFPQDDITWFLMEKRKVD
jgi:spore coat polysaccharide biosynthesis protein SpsF